MDIRPVTERNNKNLITYALGLRWRGSRSVEPVLQSEAAECGLACLCMVARHHGLEIDIHHLRQRCETSLKGITLSQLMDIAQSLNLLSRPLRVEMSELYRLKLPCILHWELDHFVVLERVTRKGLQIVDPAVGRRHVTHRLASESFTGIALELSPTTQFETGKASARLQLMPFFRGARGLYRGLLQLLLFSIALQIFALITPFYAQIVVDDVLLSGDRDLLLLLGVVFGLLVLVDTLVTVARGWVVLYLGTQLQYSWFRDLFRHLLHLPLAYFEKRHIGDIQSRFGSLRAVQELVSTQAVAALIDGLMATTTLVVMLLYNGSLTLVVAISLLLYALLRMLFLPQLRLKSNEALLAEAQKESYFLESIRGILSIKSFARERQRESGLGIQQAKALNASAQTRKIDIWLNSGYQLLFGLQNVAVIWLGALAILEGTFTVGMLLAFLAYKNQFTQRSSALVDRIAEFRLATIHLDRLADVVHTKAEVEPDRVTADISVPLRGEIELRNVWFRYADTEPYVLSNVNLHIKSGEHVAITAPSGFGKTTLIKIIMGLLQPSRGEVLVDGKPLQHYAINLYRSQVCAVMQEDQLLAGSLLDNITFFDPDADYQLAIMCSQMAAINDEIVLMPMQYHTLVGDMGAALSGGQKQRVLLARALYQRPRVLILDEASSHLDAALEARTVAAIRTLSITRIVVAHRRETLEQVDRLIRLDADPT